VSATLINAGIPAQIAQDLTKAWEFLSGERRRFDVETSNGTHPPYAEFSVFMPLNLHSENRTAGVGVLIQREDAMVVASHMFGMEKNDLCEDDLRDACAEVCNVFSGCVRPQVSVGTDVAVGLPSQVDTSDFDEISKGSVLTLTYRCGQTIKKLFVLVYGVFLTPNFSH